MMGVIDQGRDDIGSLSHIAEASWLGSVAHGISACFVPSCLRPPYRRHSKVPFMSVRLAVDSTALFVIAPFATPFAVEERRA